MNQEQQMVREFHHAMGHPWRTTPQLIDLHEVDLRLRLIEEEVQELTDALMNDDLGGIAQEIADCLYVLYGIGGAHGIDIESIFAEVHRANMAKKGGPMIPGGKQGRPPGWQPPDIAGCLTRQSGEEP
jgi:predicted HAD superfamily Cof-like phosphohydrolase